MQNAHPNPNPDESPLVVLIAWAVVGTVTIWGVLVFVVLLLVM